MRTIEDLIKLSKNEISTVDVLSHLILGKWVLFRDKNNKIKMGKIRELRSYSDQIKVKIEVWSSRRVKEISLSRIEDILPKGNPSVRNESI